MRATAMLRYAAIALIMSSGATLARGRLPCSFFHEAIVGDYLVVFAVACGCFFDAGWELHGGMVSSQRYGVGVGVFDYGVAVWVAFAGH